MIKVTDLNTESEYYFHGITHAEAVVSAWYQSKGNMNTWSYDFTKAKKSKSGRTVACGDFVAILSREGLIEAKLTGNRA